MRPEVLSLIGGGHLPSEDERDEAVWAHWDAAVRRIAGGIATDDEARALLGVLPRGEDAAFGLVWPLLHFIETAPSWPLVAELDDRSPWIKLLRERAQRA